MNRDVYRYLFSTYGRNRNLWIGYIGTIIQTLLVRVFVVILLAQVAANLASGDIEAAKTYTLYYLVSYIVGTIIGTLGELLSVRTEDDEYEKLTLNYHAKLIDKDMAFYRDNQTGYLTSAFRQHLDGVLELVRFWRGEALGVIVSLTIPAIVLLVVSFPVGLIAVAVVFLQGVYVIWSSRKAHAYRKRSHEAYRRVTAEVSDEITNIVAFKSGGIEKRARDTMYEFIREETEAFWMRRKTATLLDLPRGIVTAIGTALAVYVIIATTNGSDPATIGLIVLTLTYMFQIVRNVSVLPSLITAHDDYITKVAPTLQLLSDSDHAVRDPEHPRPLRITKATIDISHMDFGYTPQHGTSKYIPVFEDFNLHIADGEQIGVVGLSGAGKSTLANLLLRFDDITGGAITIDGTDIRDVRQSDLRRHIAYVPQEPLLFHRSVRENIAYFNPDASDKDIKRAARAAHAHEFIQKLPNGYDTLVGERGIKLSGGQKQRVAIARAILKRAPIILFDEATSALDSESEQIIQRALPEILGKQTAIVVAHRLSTVAKLDRIIVIHEGKIAEQGTHQELLKRKGRYYSLWQKQINEGE